jgi:hypothetical protein
MAFCRYCLLKFFNNMRSVYVTVFSADQVKGCNDVGFYGANYRRFSSASAGICDAMYSCMLFTVQTVGR